MMLSKALCACCDVIQVVITESYVAVKNKEIQNQPVIHHCVAQEAKKDVE